ncbi:hypothetical protein [Bacteroidetes bacterium endosymbiont of Geopemphigus sp.]|nr:hypothetical protein [Bacteroidetes bacterium endosymbiont of Geopemphigus sp.]
MLKSTSGKIPLVKNLEWRYGDKTRKALDEIVVPDVGWFEIDSLIELPRL